MQQEGWACPEIPRCSSARAPQPAGVWGDPRAGEVSQSFRKGKLRLSWWPGLWFNCWFNCAASWGLGSLQVDCKNPRREIPCWFSGNSSLASKLDAPTSAPLVWFRGLFCFHLFCNPRVRSGCGPGDGEGQLRMNQALQKKQRPLSSWMSHPSEIQSTARNPFSDNLTWKLKEASGTFYGGNCSTFCVFPASSWTRLSNKSPDQAKHFSRCFAPELISTPLTLTQA